jgi:peptidoglycan/LPS O-acetylase OafA/YrhL
MRSATSDDDGVTPLRHDPALTGVRGVAIGLVLAHHAGWLGGGVFGVHLFFVLSGFLITSILLREQAETSTISLGRFYWRRALRLLPALVVVLVFVVLITMALRPGVVPWPALLGLLYSSNVAKAAGYNLSPLSHLWSLAQEEQFYLLWPPLLLVLLRHRTSALRIVGGLAIAACLIAMNRYYQLASGASAERLVSSPDTMSDPLLVGCIAGLIYTRNLFPRLQAWANRMWPIPLAIVIATVVLADHRESYLQTLVPFELCVGALIVTVASSRAAALRIALSFPALVWVGTISYGLYLWQGVFFGLGASIAIPLAFIASLLSYRYVETPFLRRKNAARDGSGVGAGRTAPVHQPVAAAKAHS